MDLTALADDALLESTRRVLRQSLLVETDLLLHLGEVDARKLFRQEACSSLWAFCIDVLHFSENVASARIDVARLLRRLPRLADVLRSGAIHLTGLKLLSDHLTEENCDQLVSLATGKTKREIEELIVTLLAPKPLVVDSIRKLPVRATEAAVVAAPPEPLAVTLVAAPVTPPATHRPKLQPLAPDAFKVQFTADTELRDLLLEAKELLRHQNPTGDLAIVIKKSLRLLVARVKKERFGIGAKPRKSSRSPSVESTPHSSQEEWSAGGTTPHFSQERSSAATRTPQCQSLEATPYSSQEPCAAQATPHSSQEQWPAGGRAREAVGSTVEATPHSSQEQWPAGDARDALDSSVDATGRYIAVHIRREVYSRDGGRCTFRSADGRRCSATGWLEFDHVEGFALTHSHSVDGLRLRCKPHNQLAAEELYGTEFMARARSSKLTPTASLDLVEDAASVLDAAEELSTTQGSLF